MAIKINKNTLDFDYAVRGKIPTRAAELKGQGKKIYSCNIGNPQALGSKPIRSLRRILAMVEDPDKISRERKLKAANLENILNPDELNFNWEIDKSEFMLEKMGKGTGPYTASQGFAFVRDAVADFINKRDGHLTSSRANANSIFLTDGASVPIAMGYGALITNPNDGIMISAPQYPLNSAEIVNNGGKIIFYHPDPNNEWRLTEDTLMNSFLEAKSQGTNVVALNVTNPHNPLGTVMSKSELELVRDFALKANIPVVFADEVYQDNTYGREFVSFASVAGESPLTIFSLHSTSKGYLGECGKRGGYMEIRNPGVVEGTNQNIDEIMVKVASKGLCSNTIGQLTTYFMVTPPTEADGEVFEYFNTQKNENLNNILTNANMAKQAFSDMGIKVRGDFGAMYLFGALEKGVDDADYCMNLLEDTGVCVVNGAGFGAPGYFRFAALLGNEEMKEALGKWTGFHATYMEKHHNKNEIAIEKAN